MLHFLSPCACGEGDFVGERSDLTSREIYLILFKSVETNKVYLFVNSYVGVPILLRKETP